MEHDQIPWDELDPPIVELVGALNEFPGIDTIGSCAGHDNPSPAQWSANRWFVTFELAMERDTLAPTEEAWVSLEWLAWYLDRGDRRRAYLVPTSPPPYLNTPGRSMRFAVEGYRDGEGGLEPDDLAASLDERKAELYYPAEVARRWGEDDEEADA